MPVTDIHIPFRDLPEWAKRVCSERKLRPTKIPVYVGDKARCGGNWHDANVKEVHFHRGGETASIHSANGDNYINCDRLERAVYDYGFEQPLQPGDMILVTNTYPRKAEIFVHPAAMPKLIRG